MLVVESTVHRTVTDQAGSFEASTRTRGDKTRTRHKKLSCRTHENALSVVCLFPPPPSATRICRPKILAWIGGGIAGFVRLHACDRCAEGGNDTQHGGVHDLVPQPSRILCFARTRNTDRWCGESRQQHRSSAPSNRREAPGSRDDSIGVLTKGPALASIPTYPTTVPHT